MGKVLQVKPAVILIFGVAILACVFSSCLPNTKLYEEFSETHIVPPYGKMVLVSGDNLSNKGRCLNHYVIVDSINCVSCLSNKLVLWEEFETQAKKVNSFYHLTFIVEGGDFSTMELLRNISKFRGRASTFYLDSLRIFENKYPILNELSAFRSFVLDNNGKVICFGDPTTNPKLRLYFIEALKSNENPSKYCEED